jgi:hypothetical protein
MIAVAVGMALLAAARVASAPAGQRPEPTAIWQPEPPVVTPEPAGTVSPPSDAVVLFDGKDLSQWVSTRDKSPAHWTVSDGILTVRKGTGNIETRGTFRNFLIHLEWRIPEGITGG